MIVQRSVNLQTGFRSGSIIALYFATKDIFNERIWEKNTKYESNLTVFLTFHVSRSKLGTPLQRHIESSDVNTTSNDRIQLQREIKKKGWSNNFQTLKFCVINGIVG